jgi:galactose-1-phosphate uridylyltransferase
VTEPLVRLADGTVKQVSPLTGTTVWTVPGRANRPLPGGPTDREPVDPQRQDAWCAFCSRRYLDTTPEKARLVLDPQPRLLFDLPASALFDTTAELRRIGNLFEILSVEYWRTNHGYLVPDRVRERARRYLAEPAGRAHLEAVLTRRAVAAGRPVPAPAELVADAVDLFAGSHDVVVARRHLVDGARYTDQLAGSGTLTPDEHARFVDLTAQTVQDLYVARPRAVYVAAFQNWLAPAGASFDHLHKQVVAVDEYGPQVERERAHLQVDPQVYNHAVLDVAVRHGLVVARNEHAVAIAGVGHRYPALEVYATGPEQLPWLLPAGQRRAVSDLVHALHAAAGVHTPSNEEWHYRPPSVPEPMPWRIVIKWRVSTLAGFEGGTKIHVNTIDPWALRTRVVEALVPLRAAGAVAPMDLGDECQLGPGILRYATGSGR